MKIQIDLKSALLGLFIGMGAIFVMGAGTSTNPVGRYQISAADGVAGLIVDTQTGEAWGIDLRSGWGANKPGDFWSVK